MLKKNKPKTDEAELTSPNAVSVQSCGLSFEKIEELIFKIKTDGTLNYKFKVLDYQVKNYPASFRAFFYPTQDEFTIKFAGIHNSYYYIETLNLRRNTKAHIYRMMKYLKNQLKSEKERFYD